MAMASRIAWASSSGTASVKAARPASALEASCQGCTGRCKTRVLGDNQPLQVVPSLGGTELAIVVANSDGDATGIRIVLVGDRQQIAKYALPPGANRAPAGWLVAP